LNTVPLYHKIIGEGEPLIIIHGLFGMSDNWASFARRVAEERMVILVDARDHGRSPHTDEINYELIAEDLAKVMEDNWIHHADVLGHSMGGKAAMKLASLHSSMVSRLIIVDIGPGENPDRHTDIFNAMESVDLVNGHSRKEIEDHLLQDIHSISTVRFLMKNLARNKGFNGFRWKMNLPLLRKHFPDILASIELDHIDIPTLFVRGEDSDYIDPIQESIIEAHFNHYEIVDIPEAGHWVHADQPDALYDTLYDFLNKNND
jgi:pimeloyl-ACP methyl ester carboxylesterase